MVGGFINTMKTTFDFNLDLYQAFKQHGYTKHGNKEKLSIKKKASLCKLFNSKKKLLNNQNLNKNVVFIVLI